VIYLEIQRKQSAITKITATTRTSNPEITFPSFPMIIRLYNGHPSGASIAVSPSGHVSPAATTFAFGYLARSSV
jgi:hypothetical protein